LRGLQFDLRRSIFAGKIVTVPCKSIWSDWTDIAEVRIDLSEFSTFDIVWRGRGSWHIIGRYNKGAEEEKVDLTKNGVVTLEALILFIQRANSYNKNKLLGRKVVSYRNEYYLEGFEEELIDLLKCLSKSK